MDATAKKRILIVEDEDALAHMMRLRLEKLGYEITLAHDGEEGLKRVAEAKPDLILLDLLLPIVDGVTVCKKIKTDPGTRHITIIFVSAIEKTELAEKCAEAGADGYILKPIAIKGLLEKITALIG